MYGALSNYKEEWENVGEQLMMFFVYTYFCGAVYDDMVCSKMEMALFSIRWVQEFLIVRWLENGKTIPASRLKANLSIFLLMRTATCGNS